MLYLIKFNSNDRPLFAQVLKNPAVMANITGKPICDDDIQQAWERILKINGENDIFGYYKIIFNTHYVGYGKLNLDKDIFNKPCSEIGYFLLPEFWRQGIGYQVELELIHLTQNCPYPIIATVSQENIISKKLLTKLGFIFAKNIELDGRVGKFGLYKI